MRWLLAGIILLAFLSPFAFGLTDLDEGFYASVAREMFSRNDWLTPTLGNSPWFEKPPLLYWLMSLSMQLFGASEFAVRLPSLLASMFTIILIVSWGGRRFGRAAGDLAGIIFALAPLAMLLGRLAITDMLLTLWLTLAVIALWETRQRAIWFIVGGIATGLAVLTKGPVGLGFIGLLYLINAKSLHQQGLRFRWVLLALIVALCVPIPWFAGVYMQHGRDFFEEFILKQNLARFAGGDTAHSVLSIAKGGGLLGILGAGIAYLLFYVIVFWLGLFPFSTSANALWQRDSDPLYRYLRSWCLLVFLFFTLGLTKLPAYIFPMFPFAALLIARYLTSRSEAAQRAPLTRWQWASLFVGSCLWLCVALFLGFSARQPTAILFGMGLIGAAMAYLSMHLRGGVQTKPAMRALAICAFGVVLGLHFSLRAYDRLFLQPVRDLARSVPPYRTLIVHKVSPGYPSLYFYRQSQVVLDDNPDNVMSLMREKGSYCLTGDSGFVSRPQMIEVGRSQTLNRVYSLIVSRYN